MCMCGKVWWGRGTGTRVVGKVGKASPKGIMAQGHVGRKWVSSWAEPTCPRCNKGRHPPCLSGARQACLAKRGTR